MAYGTLNPKKNWPKNMSYVTCHLSFTTTARDTHPPPAYSPTMHKRVVCEEPKLKEFLKFLKVIAEHGKRSCLPKTQYKRYALEPEVSSPSGSVFSNL